MKTNHRRNFKARQEYRKGYFGPSFRKENVRRDRRSHSSVAHSIVRGLDADSDLVNTVTKPVLD